MKFILFILLFLAWVQPTHADNATRGLPAELREELLANWADRIETDEPLRAMQALRAELAKKSIPWDLWLFDDRFDRLMQVLDFISVRSEDGEVVKLAKENLHLIKLSAQPIVQSVFMSPSPWSPKDQLVAIQVFFFAELPTAEEIESFTKTLSYFILKRPSRAETKSLMKLSQEFFEYALLPPDVDSDTTEVDELWQARVKSIKLASQNFLNALIEVADSHPNPKLQNEAQMVLAPIRDSVEEFAQAKVYPSYIRSLQKILSQSQINSNEEALRKFEALHLTKKEHQAVKDLIDASLEACKNLLED